MHKSPRVEVSAVPPSYPNSQLRLPLKTKSHFIIVPLSDLMWLYIYVKILRAEDFYVQISLFGLHSLPFRLRTKQKTQPIVWAKPIYCLKTPKRTSNFFLLYEIFAVSQRKIPLLFKIGGFFCNKIFKKPFFFFICENVLASLSHFHVNSDS